MGDKLRGALSGIDWSKSNQTSINIQRNNQASINVHRSNSSETAVENNKTNNATQNKQNQSQQQQQRKPTDLGDIPINPYPSVIAPVKSGKTDEGNKSKGFGNKIIRSDANKNEPKPEDLHIYVGFLGSIRVKSDSQSSTGIMAIQAPMRELYFPYRLQKPLAQERVLYLSEAGMEVFYLASPDAEEPSSYCFAWEDILYVEPLKFSTRVVKGKKDIRGAFEPSESQRLTMLGNRDSLYYPLSKDQKHISLLKHPALLCVVVRNPQEPGLDLFTHGFVCSTVEESVLLAKTIRDEIEVMLANKAIQPRTHMERTISASTLSLASKAYSIQDLRQPPDGVDEKKKKEKEKKKKKSKGLYTVHNGTEEEDLGSFHLGMTEMPKPSEQSGKNYDEEPSIAFNDNFAIGRPNNIRNSNRISNFSDVAYDENDDDDDDDYNRQNRENSFRGDFPTQNPPQTSFRDAFKVLPTDVHADKSQLKPTFINTKPKNYNEVTSELESKLKIRQSELHPLAPRQVVNPLADTAESSRKSFIDIAPGPLSKMKGSLPFNANPALPQSTTWHENVMSNFKAKERIENKLESQSVDLKELPKIRQEKKEQEIANLFTDVKVEPDDATDDNNTINSLHDALGFLP